MPPTPLRRFETDTVRLKFLYETTQYSYGQSARALIRQIKSGEVEATKPFKLSPNQDEGKGANAYAVFRRLKTQFPKYLRETVLVRLISSLEVFLLDEVREVFLARRDLFHTDNKRLDFSYGELLSASSVTELWSKVINKDIRSLQNQGFKEIVKFYRTRLGIDLGECGISMERLEEFHDRRHILVHRLGITDDEYRHRYKTDIKRTTVTDEYLTGCMSDLAHLASWVHERSTKKMAEAAPGSSASQPKYKIEISVETLSDNVPEILKPNFGYRVGERIHQLSDFLVSRTIESNTHTLTIEGETAPVRAYLKLLKESAGRGHISVRQKRLLRSEPLVRSKWKFSDDLLKQIWDGLPAQPWPQHLHKQVAKDFNLSNSQAAIALGLFIQCGGKLSSEKSSSTAASSAEAS